MPGMQGDEKYRKIVETAKKITEESKTDCIEDELEKVVIFTLGGVRYAFFGRCVKSILPCETITPVPGCPDYILGIINVRGDIESVVNINHFIGIKDESVDGKARIVIAEASGVRSGILVGSVEDVIDVTQNAILPSLSTIENTTREFVSGELNYNNSLVTILNIEKIFGRIDA